VRLDPLTPDQRTGLGWIYFNAGRYEDSLRVLAERHPASAWGKVPRTYEAWNHALAGRYQEAIDILEGESAESSGLLHRASLGWALARAGRRAEAEEILSDLEARVGEGADPYLAAVVAAGLDDAARAMRWLERAHEQHSPNMIHVKIEPFFGPLRRLRAYDRLVERMKL